jgi:carbon storage regulator
MLVLSRKCRQMIVIGGAKGFDPVITVTVLEIKGNAVRLGIAADAAVPVHRWEVWQQLQDGHPNGVPALAGITTRQVASEELMAEQVKFELHQAFEQVRESERAIRLNEETILPAARENVKTAQAAYDAGGIPHLSLVDAQRNLTTIGDRCFRTTAEYHRRRAKLEQLTFVPALIPQLTLR